MIVNLTKMMASELSGNRDLWKGLSDWLNMEGEAGVKDEFRDWPE